MSRRPGTSALGTLLATVLLLGAALPEAGPLLDAARQGDVATVRSLLEGGADPNEAQGDGMTALHWAAELGSLEIAELLIDAEARVEARTRVGAYTPLHLASRSGHDRVALELLEAGSDMNAKTTNSGVTPLHLAARAVDGERAVRVLLDRGAAVNAQEESSGQTPLMFASAYGRVGAVELLLDHGADPSVSTEVVDVVRSLATDRAANQRLRDALGLGERPPDRRPGGGGYQEGAVPREEPSPAQVQAAIEAQRAFLRSDQPLDDFDPADLIQVRPHYPGGPDISHPPYRETLVGKTGGMTALLHGAREGHTEVAKALLDGGAGIDQVSADGTSPLLMATLNGQFDLALALIERGANPNLASTTEAATSLFAVLQTQWAPKSNYPQPRAQDDQQAEYLDVLSGLLEAGADPNVPLSSHLWYWEFGLTKMGVDLTGATPFWRAAFAQDLPAMKVLVAHGADVNMPTRWPAVGMRERRQQDGRQQEDSGLPWIPEGAPNAYPLHAAAGGGWTGLGAFSVRSVPSAFLPAVKYLIEEHEADIDLRDSWGYTPLHYAASRGDNELIEYLVSKGADVKAITRLGQSTADLARGGRSGFFTRVAYSQTVELLQSLGSTLECLHAHFLDTGDFCAGAGLNDPYKDYPGRGTPIGFPNSATDPQDPPQPGGRGGTPRR